MDERLKAQIAANPARFDDQDAPAPDNSLRAQDQLAKDRNTIATRRAARAAK